MFGQKRDAAQGAQEPANQEAQETNETQSPARTPEEAAQSSGRASPRMRNVLPAQHRPAIELPHSSRRSSPMSGDDRQLTVGKGLSLAGEITSCDVLVVEGKVEAKLSDGKMLQIAESGQFRGSVEIENADIAGRYDGQLVVHGRLTVRSTGRISGMVKYGELEVNVGGQIIGEVQVAGPAAAQQGGNNFRSAAKMTSFGDEEEQQPEQRKLLA